KPDDFVIATGETHSVKEFVELSFDRVGLDWKKYVEVDKSLFRPAEVHQLIGDASKAKRILKWEPTISFKELINMMIDSDMEYYKKKIG
ncbi:GDP-mannose 4,6-dehydratase, partial [candidate division WOR-3 bacterium]|nr:GDP-mannose 4,6-dehydratase [candidate division WOR-3 bacterium]